MAHHKNLGGDEGDVTKMSSYLYTPHIFWGYNDGSSLIHTCGMNPSFAWLWTSTGHPMGSFPSNIDI